MPDTVSPEGGEIAKTMRVQAAVPIAMLITLGGTDNTVTMISPSQHLDTDNTVWQSRNSAIESRC